MTAIVELRRTPASVRLERTRATKETRANWLRWITDPEIHKWIAGNLPSHPDEVYRWLEKATTDPKRHYFDIVSDGKTVGFINLRQDQFPQATGEIGIVIGETSYHGRGIGTQAVSDLLSYAKHTAHLTSVRALIKPDNERSIRLFTSAGFVYTQDVSIDGTHMLKFEKILI